MPCGALDLRCLLCHCLSWSFKIQQTNVTAPISGGYGIAGGLWLHVQDFYGLTLDALREAKNDRLWFKTQLKLCGLWLKLREYSRGAKILRELHRCCGQLC